MEPGPDAWRDGVLENQRRIAVNDRHGWAGMAIGDLRRFAREQLLAEARRHTGRYRGVDGDMASASPLLLTGHQPQLFHPGVWLKNFVLAALARQVAAPAVNLIIDNDTIRAAAIRVPRVANLGDAGASMIEFDRPGDEVPFEDALTTGFSGLTKDGSTLYLSDSRGRNTSALFALDVASGQKTLVHEDPRADVGDSERSPITGKVQADGSVQVGDGG